MNFPKFSTQSKWKINFACLWQGQRSAHANSKYKNAHGAETHARLQVRQSLKSPYRKENWNG
jgi:hypothetical protein